LADYVKASQEGEVGLKLPVYIYDTTDNSGSHSKISYKIYVEAQKVEVDYQHSFPVKMAKPSTSDVVNPSLLSVDLGQIIPVVSVQGFLSDQTTVINGTSNTEITAAQAMNYLISNILFKGRSSQAFINWRGFTSELSSWSAFVSGTNSIAVVVDKVKFIDSIMRADRSSGGIARIGCELSLTVGRVRSTQ